MTSRDRVLEAIHHEETDRVPLDLGSTVMSGIMAHALHRLRKHLGIQDRPVRVYEVFQMLGQGKKFFSDNETGIIMHSMIRRSDSEENICMRGQGSGGVGKSPGEQGPSFS